MIEFKFDWDSRLELGIPSIDTHHQHFFKLGRDVEQLLLTHCAGVTDKELLNLLYELRTYITYHFYEEEKIMREINYPDYEKHCIQHQEFMYYINHIDYLKLCQQPVSQLNILKEKFVDWSFSHIIHEDQKLTSYYEKALKTSS